MATSDGVTGALRDEVATPATMSGLLNAEGAAAAATSSISSSSRESGSSDVGSRAEGGIPVHIGDTQEGSSHVRERHVKAEMVKQPPNKLRCHSTIAWLWL